MRIISCGILLLKLLRTDKSDREQKCSFKVLSYSAPTLPRVFARHWGFLVQSCLLRPCPNLACPNLDFCPDLAPTFHRQITKWAFTFFIVRKYRHNCFLFTKQTCHIAPGINKYNSVCYLLIEALSLCQLHANMPTIN